MRGTRPQTDLPATPPIAVYNEAELETLLAGNAPEPEGIRFHFDRPSGTETVGLIAVSLIVVSPEPTTVSTHELSNSTKKYVQRGARSAEMTKTEFTQSFPAIAAKGLDSNNSVCVFFSRTDLREILDQEGVTRVAFFPASIERNFTGRTESFDTLLAIGQTADGVTQGIQIKSELPCPPHCGEDYPPE